MGQTMPLPDERLEDTMELLERAQGSPILGDARAVPERFAGPVHCSRSQCGTRT